MASRSWRSLSVVALAGFLSQVAACMPVRTPVGFVLSPATGPTLRREFERLRPHGVTLEKIKVQRASVDLRVCGPGPGCTPVRIDPASPACVSVVGTWCVTWPEGAPSGPLVGMLELVLTGTPEDLFQPVYGDDPAAKEGARAAPPVDPDAVRAEEEARREAQQERLAAEAEANALRVEAQRAAREADPEFQRLRAEDRLAYLLALATLVVPLAAGAAGGRLARRILGRRVRSNLVLAAILLFPTLPWMFVPTRWISIGMWDLLLMGALMAAGVALTLHEAAQVDTRALALGGLSVLAGLAILEAGVRWLLPIPAACQPPSSAHLVLTDPYLLPRNGDHFRAGLFPGLEPYFLESQTRTATARSSRVLHVGDSMTFGSGVIRDEAFPQVLARIDPQVGHINGGVPGAGPDYYWLLTREWTRRVPVDLVVWHVFPSNDVIDVDFPYALCGNGPLLDYPPDGPPTPRCPDAPVAGQPDLPPWAASPPPYALRVGTGLSFLARTLFGFFYQGYVDWLVRTPRDVLERHLEAATAAARDDMKAQGIAFLLTALPYRAAMTGPDPKRLIDENAFVADMARRLDIPFLDSLAFFQEGVAREGDSAWFLDEPPGDVHLSREGHRKYAEWLKVHVEPAAGISLRRAAK